MKHNLIGTTEYVYLPEVMEGLLPAKIDTGADGSAIWASSIEESDGQLSFVLFAPQSAFYSGEVITTNDYRIVNVKNSFGEKEHRYRVKLRMKIARRTYLASFTLADRSRSRFPILIGKRFLKGRFLVDVSRHNLTQGADGEEVSGRVIVLTSRTDEPTKDFFATVAELGAFSVEVAKYRLLDYRISTSGEPRIMLPDGTDIASAQTVYLKAHALYPEHAGAVARYLQYRHVNFIDREIGHSVSRSKLSELFALSTYGVPVPAMRVYSSGLAGVDYEAVASYFEADKFILKDAFADRGKSNYLVSDAASYQQAVERLDGIKTVIAQQYIENNGYLRVTMMAGDIAQVVSRTAVSHEDALKSHLNKPRGSANATELKVADYPVDAMALAARAASIMERTVAGVDLIQDKLTDKWYVLEVNYNPELTGGMGVNNKAKAVAKMLMKEGYNR